MPGYNFHRLFNYTVFIAIAALFYLWNMHINMKQFFALGIGFYAGTELITPDLDTDSAAIKRWGRLKIFMLPYKWAFRHRQSSHNIVYGAVVRILYISLIISGLYYLLFKSLPHVAIISSVYIFIFLIGIIIANGMHVLLDKLL